MLRGSPKAFGSTLVLFSILLAMVPAVAQANPGLGNVNLGNVKKIYVEKMENNLDQYITSEISKQFHGSLQVVLEPSKADAIMKGVNIGAQNTTKATVQLVDPAGKSVLWSGTGGDRDMMFLDLKHGGEQKIAAHLVKDLKRAMQPK
jgi:hypothetical protein